MQTDKRIPKFRARFKRLRDNQTSWRKHWQEIADYTTPRKGEYLHDLDGMTEEEQGSLRNTNIINGVGAEATRILASGMQGGMTSPSRPWFILALEDRDLMEFTPVKQWLTDVRDIILRIYAKSNFYGSMHSNYSELGNFGVAAQLQEEDFETIARFRPFTVGEYMLTLDAQYRSSGLYRHFSLTTEQMIVEFGKSNVSEAVMSAYHADNLDAKFKVNHIIEPNTSIINDKAGPRGMEYTSMYFEDGGDPEAYLREKGYEGKPFIAPRWDVSGTQTYGNSPGMESLGDNKMLQKMEEKSLKAVDKQVDPPMNAHPSLKGKGGSIVPGHMNYVSVPQGQVGFAPVYQVNLNIQQLEEKIRQTEERIKTAYFNNLFLMIANDQRSNTTAFEISKRYQEKMMVLGPVINRIQSESHDPTIERTYQIGTRFGVFPEPPAELQNREIKIEYVSILAQAQKMVGATSIEQTASFIGNLGSVNPAALDKLDVDETINLYADVTGAPPKMIRGEEEVQRIRQQRAQAQQAQQESEQNAALAQGAKVMSDTKLNEDTALDSLLGRIGASGE